MRHSNSSKPFSVDSSVYDKNYYLSECDGYQEFIASKGQILPKRLTLSLECAHVRSGMQVLDIGCGRGESLIWLTNQGAKAWGIDYSESALALAKEALTSINSRPESRCLLIAANACYLPFADESFDLVLMLDVVEHLYPQELERALKEIKRVLKCRGRLFIHTAPNLWYYKFGYPIYRFFKQLQGIRLPENPRERFHYHQRVHVNEQSPYSIARVLRSAGFQPRVWLTDIQQRWKHDGVLIRILGWIATHICPFNQVFCGDIFAEAQKV
jgi:ubiquinone/menaquinone biosynthesis C-methylase UbiE